MLLLSNYFLCTDSLSFSPPVGVISLFSKNPDIRSTHAVKHILDHRDVSMTYTGVYDKEPMDEIGDSYHYDYAFVSSGTALTEGGLVTYNLHCHQFCCWLIIFRRALSLTKSVQWT